MWKNFLFAIAVITIFGCGRTSTDPVAEPVDETATSEEAATAENTAATQTPENIQDATVEFAGMNNYEVLKGSIKVVANATNAAVVNLLIGETVVATDETAPFEFDLDTTQIADGILKLSLQAGLTKDQLTATAKREMIVLNRGQEVQYEDGFEGKVIVGAAGYVDQHLKFHWTMPAEIRGVVSVLYWDNPEFKLELSIGTGECPHSGKTMANAESQSSPLGVAYQSSGAVLKNGTTWFSHVQLKNPNLVLGKETPFKLKAYLLK